MTKILHLTYDMRIGGTEMVIKNLIEGNTDDSIEMSIYCLESPIGPWGEELKDKGVPICGQARKPGFDISLIKAIRQYIKAHHIDIVHCHQYTPWVYGALAAALTKTKVIFTEHGRFYPDSSSWKRGIVNPLLMKLTDHVTAISSATKRALVDFEFIPEKAIDVVYNGIKPLKVDTSRQETIEQLGLPKGAFIFGTVARLDPIKNQTMMINAFAKVTKNNQNTYLVIVGDGEMRLKLESLVESLGLQERVIFTGYISDPKELIDAFDIFLLSSLSEGTSMTLLEAMSLGKPCIVTDAGGNKEVVVNQYNGIVCNNDNLKQFSVSMINLFNDNKTLEKMKENSKEVFDQKFSVVKMLDCYKKIYGQNARKFN